MHSGWKYYKRERLLQNTSLCVRGENSTIQRTVISNITPGHAISENQVLYWFKPVRVKTDCNKRQQTKTLCKKELYFKSLELQRPLIALCVLSTYRWNLWREATVKYWDYNDCWSIIIELILTCAWTPVVKQRTAPHIRGWKKSEAKRESFHWTICFVYFYIDSWINKHQILNSYETHRLIVYGT